VEKRTKILAGIFLSGLALGFSAVFVIALLGGINILPLYRMEPEDILPAQNTVFLLHNATPQDIAAWSTVFAEIRSEHYGATSLAIVQSSNGDRQVIRFDRLTRNTSSGCNIGKYQIESANGDVCPDAVAHHGATLADEAGYKALGKPPKGSWAFVRTDAVTEALDLIGRIMESSVLSSASHMRIAQEDSDRIITLWPVSPPSHTYDLPALPASNAVFSLGTGNLQDTVERVLSTLSTPDRLTARGLLLTQSAALFGPDISLEHRLLPLLTEPSSIAIVQTASGSRILVTGSADTASDALEAMDELHAAFRLRHPDIAVVERTFDERFPLKTMRVSEERISTENGTIRGWDIRATKDSGDDRLLITALRGKEVQISNSIELLLSSLAESSATAIPVSHRPIAKKTVQAAVLPAKWFQHSPLLKIISPSGNSLIVVIEQLGETGYVRLQEKRE
jgi:hypothetical protein